MWHYRARALRIVSVLVLPFAISALFQQGLNIFVLVWEAVFQLLCLAALLRVRHKSFERNVLVAALLCLLVADASFNVRTLLGYSAVGWPRHLADLSYTGFTVAMIAFLVRRLRVFARGHRSQLLLCAAVAAISLALQCVFVIAHLETSSLSAFPLLRAHYWVYSLLAATLAGLSVPFSLFTRSSRTHLFLQSVICFQTFDLAIRYKNSQVVHQYHSWAEAGWAAGIAALCLSIITELGRERPWWSEHEPLAPWNSIRVFVGGSVFVANLMVMGAVILCNIFLVRNAFDLSAALAIVFFCWVASNGLAIVVAGQLDAMEQSIPMGPMIHDDANLATLKFTQVHGRAYLVEWDRMIAKYNALVIQANAVLGQLMEKNRDAALARMASQVAHDIGSPLSALNVALADAGQLPEETRTLMRSAVHRIQDISYQLLERRRALEQDAEPQPAVQLVLMTPLVDSVLSEKRTEYRSKLGLQLDMSLDAAGYGVFASIPPGPFKAVLSNVLNNALEAMEAVGTVQVSVRRDGSWATVMVTDSGPGIPPEVLGSLGGGIATYGKACGNGLGIYQATQQVESWGGRVHFCSQQGVGTMVRFQLPLGDPPPWFLPQLSVRPYTRVVVLDDDVTIHNIWRGRLVADAAGVEIHNLSTPAALEAWVDTYGRAGALFLLDYELLGFNENGIDIAERLDLGHQAVLVTSRFEEPEVLQRCVQAKLPLIPKSAAPIVPIAHAESMTAEAAQAIDCVLIDDDPIFHCAWNLRAREAGKKIRCYARPTEFLQDAALYRRVTPIHVDSDLGYALPGEHLAKTLKALCFDRVILTTGYAATDFAHCHWLDGVIGKEPPF